MAGAFPAGLIQQVDRDGHQINNFSNISPQGARLISFCIHMLPLPPSLFLVIFDFILCASASPSVSVQGWTFCEAKKAKQLTSEGGSAPHGSALLPSPVSLSFQAHPSDLNPQDNMFTFSARFYAAFISHPLGFSPQLRTVFHLFNRTRN